MRLIRNAADFVTMKSGAIAISAENFNAEASNGIVTTAVNVDEPMTVSDDRSIVYIGIQCEVRCTDRLNLDSEQQSYTSDGSKRK